MIYWLMKEKSEYIVLEPQSVESKLSNFIDTLEIGDKMKITIEVI